MTQPDDWDHYRRAIGILRTASKMRDKDLTEHDKELIGSSIVALTSTPIDTGDDRYPLIHIDPMEVAGLVAALAGLFWNVIDAIGSARARGLRRQSRPLRQVTFLLARREVPGLDPS